MVGEALRNELARLKFRKTVLTSFGAWRQTKHPELARGTRAFLRDGRKSRRPRRRADR